jgi:hypothetical protein
MALQTRQRHQFGGKAKNSQCFLEGSVNSPRGRRSIRILDLYPVCTENLIRVDEVPESPKLAQ